MKRAGIFCLLVAMLAVTAQGRPTRALQELDLSKIDLSKIPVLPALGLMPTGVELPPLSEFLPPLDSINLPPLNEFLTKVGLPTWEEMNLPPLSEFMKPVFDPQAVELPSLNDLVKQANETFVATLKDIVGDIPLPPGVKLPDLKLPPLPNVDLSKIKLPDIDTTKLPQLPSLDKLIDILNSIQSGKMPNISTIPGLENLKLPENLPPLQDVMTALAPLADLVGKLSQIDLSKVDLATILNGGGSLNLPALAEVLKALPELPKNLPAFGEIAKVVVGLLGKASSGRHLLAEMDINDLIPQADMVSGRVPVTTAPWQMMLWQQAPQQSGDTAQLVSRAGEPAVYGLLGLNGYTADVPVAYQDSTSPSTQPMPQLLPATDPAAAIAAAAGVTAPKVIPLQADGQPGSDLESSQLPFLIPGSASYDPAAAIAAAAGVTAPKIVPLQAPGQSSSSLPNPQTPSIVPALSYDSAAAVAAAVSGVAAPSVVPLSSAVEQNTNLPTSEKGDPLLEAARVAHFIVPSSNAAAANSVWSGIDTGSLGLVDSTQGSWLEQGSAGADFGSADNSGSVNLFDMPDGSSFLLGTDPKATSISIAGDNHSSNGDSEPELLPGVAISASKGSQTASATSAAARNMNIALFGGGLSSAQASAPESAAADSSVTSTSNAALLGSASKSDAVAHSLGPAVARSSTSNTAELGPVSAASHAGASGAVKANANSEVNAVAGQGRSNAKSSVRAEGPEASASSVVSSVSHSGPATAFSSAVAKQTAGLGRDPQADSGGWGVTAVKQMWSSIGHGWQAVKDAVDVFGSNVQQQVANLGQDITQAFDQLANHMKATSNKPFSSPPAATRI